MTLGVIAGLVIGKPLGIVAAAFVAVRTGLGRLPDGVTWPHIGGIGALAGIGFTVSLFITGLAFDTPTQRDEAALGVLAASVLAALVGVVVLSRIPVPGQDDQPDAQPKPHSVSK